MDKTPMPQCEYNTRMAANDVFRIGKFELSNRLFVGTGKYSSYEVMQQALEASGCQVVTVAVRRERLVDKQGRSLLDYLDLEKYIILPNTAGCFTAEDAIRVSLLGRDLLEKQGNKGAGWVKLEVLGDKKTLLPDPVGTLEATRELVKEGFTVLAYTSDDPRLAVRLKEAGAASVMPAGSPIGSGQGVLNPLNVSLCLELLKENDASYPVILDAGVGDAKDPVKMATAMRYALESGRLSYQSGRIAKKRYATASSPFDGVISY